MIAKIYQVLVKRQDRSRSAISESDFFDRNKILGGASKSGNLIIAKPHLM